jgi:hypothetical protein
MSVCGLHHWSAYGVDCPQCVGTWRNPCPDAAPSRMTTGVSYTEAVSAADRYPSAQGLDFCLEVCARAIAANKRGKRPNDPEIDKIWATYKGQAKACILAFLEESAQRQRAEPKQRYVPRGRGRSTPPASGTSGSAQDAQRLDPKGAGPAPEGGDAQ